VLRALPAKPGQAPANISPRPMTFGQLVDEFLVNHAENTPSRFKRASNPSRSA